MNTMLSLQRTDLLLNHHFIGGQWRPSHNGAQFEVMNPATGEVIAQVADGQSDETRAAVDAAAQAFVRWRQTPARERAQLLKRWHALILTHGEDLARLISLEQGKPLTDARGEILYGASYVEWFSEEAVRANGDILPSLSASRRLMVLKEPVGVVAAITPWNFPLAMMARKWAPALAAGCTVVAKPAEDTPLTALAMARLLQEAGLPEGVVNVVCASRAQGERVVKIWLDDARVRKLTFTGSTAVGKYLARECAHTLKKLSLELGGNAPFIVFEDADLPLAVDALMKAKFRNGGQACVSPNRVYVHASVYEAFAELVTERVRGLIVGPATQPDAQVGPMINARAVDKIERHVNDAIQHGARLLVGGTRAIQGRHLGATFFAPTVLANITANMLVSCEETFGPVVPLCSFSSEAEVIALANGTPFGLAAYFFTRDHQRIWRVTQALDTGMVGINEGLIGSEAAPFGGVKDSGYGREGSRYGLDDYMHTKYWCEGIG